MWLFHDAKYEFIGRRKPAFAASAAFLVLGIAAMGWSWFSTGKLLNYGVDFTGGTLVQVRFDVPATDQDLRQALGGAEAPPITRFGADNEFVIRAPGQEEASIDETAARIAAQIGQTYGEGDFEIVRRELVGPKIGAELQQKAMLAVLFSLALTLIYIAIRFEVRFGVASVAATAHDMLAVLGFLAVFRVEISLPTVAAILTILGYSLNDTIVVFDRIRENLNKKGGRRQDPERLVNRSINETLPRTVLTSGTTLVVLLSLLVLGGVVNRDFATVLILGVLIGTYSSIFIASPALLEIQKRYGTAEGGAGKRERTREGKGRAAAAV